MYRVVLNFRDCVFSSETVTQDNMYRNYLMQSQQLFLVQKHSLNFVTELIRAGQLSLSGFCCMSLRTATGAWQEDAA